MKTKLTYVADDGTSFDTEKECIEYEKSINNIIVYYKDKETNLIKREFDNEPSAKRFIANSLHDCYEDSIVGNFKLIHCGKTVEFNSNELAHLVPAHYNIDGEKLNKIFQLSATENAKIEGYTLHGDYYLADKVIPNKTWEEACKMKKIVTLPNGKMVVAGILSEEELETIPQEERGNGKFYWTSTPRSSYNSWCVASNGSFFGSSNDFYYTVRLGFKNPFIN